VRIPGSIVASEKFARSRCADRLDWPFCAFIITGRWGRGELGSALGGDSFWLVSNELKKKPQVQKADPSKLRVNLSYNRGGSVRKALVGIGGG